MCYSVVCTGAFVIGVLATDDDAAWPNNVVTYVIEAGSRDDFVIDSLTGHLTVSDWREEPAGWYHVTVAAVDAGCPALRSICHVNISVLDTVNARPLFQTPDGHLIADGLTLVTSVAEDAKVGHVIYRCVAVNPSGADRLRYHWLNASGEVAARGFDVRGELVLDHPDYLQVRTSAAVSHLCCLFLSSLCVVQTADDDWPVCVVQICTRYFTR